MSDLELYLAVGTGVIVAIAGAASYAYKKRSERPKRHTPPSQPPPQ